MEEGEAVPEAFTQVGGLSSAERRGAGLGLTILPCLACDPVPGLRRVGSYFEGGTYLWVLTHPELRGTARVRAFTEFMREVIERDRALIEGRPPAA